MEFINPRTGKKIDLSGLNNKELEFYSRALRMFKDNTDWIEFENFAFGPKSPIYNSDSKDPAIDPLCLALEDMWIELGIQQGDVRVEK